MALFRKLFYRKPPDGLLEICEKVYVFDCCFTGDGWEEQNYTHYVGGIMAQLKEHYPDASILVFNFREGEIQSQIANAFSEFDMTIMEYPRQYEGCPLLPMEMIHHFLRSSESWLSLGLQNLLLMHCEIGGWPVLAFLLAALLIYRKQYTGEHKTLDMVYKQAPRELLHLLSPLNPVPSQLRYLQYVSRRNIGTEWPPLDRALTMDCVIIRLIPNFDGEGGCRPIFRIYGQDPFLVSDRAPKALFSTPKKSKVVRHYKQAECELVKIDINCHIQGDVVLECISLHDNMEREEVMFRVMFNTAFIRSNILMLNRDEIDILWDAKDLFPKDFRAEVLFSEMDAATSIVPMDYSCFEEKDGLPVEAFAKVQEIFSSVDWLVPKGDAAVEVLQHLALSNAVIEAYSHSEKLQEKKYSSALEYVAESPTELTPEKQSNFSPQLSPNTDAGKKQAEPKCAPNEIEAVIFTKPKLIHPGEQHPPTSTSPPPQFSIEKTLHPSRTKQSDSGDHQSDMAKVVSPLTETEMTFLETFYSTPTHPSLPTNDAAVVPRRPLVSPATLSPPLTPPLEDKTGLQGGVTPSPLWSLEMPSASSPPLKDDTSITLGLSLSSALSPKSRDKVIGAGPLKPKPPPSAASSDEDVIKASGVAPPPPPPPPPPICSSSTVDMVKCTGIGPSPQICSSSTVDVIKCTGIGPPPPSTTQSSDLNNIQTTGSGPPPPPPSPPHLSSPSMIDVTRETAPHTPSPPPNLYITPIKENLVFTDCQTPTPLPPCPSISPLTEHSSSRFGPWPPPLHLPLPPLINDLVISPSPGPTPPPTSPLFTPSLINNLVTKPSLPPPPPPPPPPLVPPNKSLSVREELPPPPPSPSPSLPQNSLLKEHLSSRVGLPSPPPSPSPSPSPSLPQNSLLKEHLSSSVGLPPPPPPPPPLAQPSMDNLSTRSAPHPPPAPPPPPMPPGGNSSIKEGPSLPPPPPMPPVGNSSIKGGPPVPLPPPLHFQQGTRPPPPPPPNPTFFAKDLSPSINSPSVPLAPPPPHNFSKEAGGLPNSPSSSSSRDSNLPGYPSPPPPTVPPPGAKGKSLLSRTVTSRNNQAKKLKPLHWLKLSRAVSGSLWAEAQRSGEASKAPEIDISELESLFSAAVPNPDHGGSGRKSSSLASMGNKPEKVQLIEHRRAYNCEIMLSKVKIPLPDLLSSVLSLEDSALDVDQVDNLIKFCPTKEEMEMLKGYTGDKDKLGKCEQFFWELMQVPRIESKLRVFSFKIQFCSQVSDLRKSLNVVNSAADQIRGSAKLKRIMQTILSLGNALNQGTARGSAIGFRLDSLLKLTETRARNNKMTLMHYLCKVLVDKLPELLDFWQDLSSLEPALKIQLKFLAEEMQAISKGLEKVVQELTMAENDGPVSDNFRKALKEFLCFSEGEVRSLASLYSGVGRNVDALIIYFGEDPSRCPFEQVISTLLNFVRMFKKAHEENCKQLEFERKKAEKEASTEKLKINASDIDNGKLIQARVSSIK